MPSLSLAGLLEAGLTITVRSDSSKVTATYRSPSLAALASVQGAIGGIAHPHPKGRPFLTLNATSVYRIAETLCPLQTPWARRYTALLALRDHKATYDNACAARDLGYRASYTSQLDALITAFRDTPIDTSPADAVYLAGAHKAGVVNQDPAIALTLTWKQDSQTIATAHRARQASAVQARLTEREQERNQREKARLEAITTRRLAREAQWAAARLAREGRRATAKRAYDEKRAQTAAKRDLTLAAIAQGARECDHCHQTKPLAQFNLNKRALGGYQPYCKQCMHERYVKPNRARANQRAKAWQAANPDTFRACCRKQNRKPSHRLRNHIRTRIKAAIDRPLGTNTHIAYLGCSIPDLRAYIETQWVEGMTWETYGLGAHQWCIDHIIPHAAFDHHNDQHLHWCWHYRNLRPLWWRKNAAKSDYIAGTSVRQYRASGRQADLHSLVAAELERLGITTQASYLASVSAPTS